MRSTELADRREPGQAVGVLELDAAQPHVPAFSASRRSSSMRPRSRARPRERWRSPERTLGLAASPLDAARIDDLADDEPALRRDVLQLRQARRLVLVGRPPDLLHPVLRDPGA